jgi:transportin-3
VLDDYVHMLQEIVDLIAPAFIQSPAFAQSLTITFTALSLPQPNIIINTIDYLVTLLRLLSPSTSSFSQQQPCNDNQSSGYATPSSSTNGATTPSSSTAALDSISSQALRTAFAQQGHTLLSLLLSGLVGGYPEDALEAIVDVLGMLSGGFGEEMIAWLPGVVEGLPATTVPAGEKQAFLTKMAS